MSRKKHNAPASDLAAIGLKQRAWRYRRSRCFELAYETIMDSTDGSGWHLVHGTAVSLAHAWLRNGAVVYDPVLD